MRSPLTPSGATSIISPNIREGLVAFMYAFGEVDT